MTDDPRRALPAVERIVHRLRATSPDLPDALLVVCAREATDAARDRIAAGHAGTADDVFADALEDASVRAATLARSLLRPVVNATGVLLHTNLGRSPISDDALAAAAAVARGYSNLEYHLESGTRGSRHEHAGALLARVCGAEAGIVVNNNAAAVLLMLAALARSASVIVSRGELVEIGGGFRVPEIMEESGCRLVEVGTTNRTRRDDYVAALTPETALVLKVHASNYRMVGFTEATAVADLVGLGPPVAVDAGSGLLDANTPWLGERPDWLHDEPGIRQVIADGAAIVTFSGDKLLGGPQAGVLLGRADLIDRCARHPLARAVRADKATLAALQSVALTYLGGEAATLPLWRMAATPCSALRARAESVAACVAAAEVVDTESVAGGGSLPGHVIPSVGVSVPVPDADAAATALRAEGVVARIERAAIVCDLRTVEPAEDDLVIAALRALAPR